MSAASHDRLSRAWLGLVGLGLATTALASTVAHGGLGGIAGAAILLIGFFKARLILRHFLGLKDAPAWRRGFEAVIGLWLLLLLGLYLIPALSAQG